MITIEMLAQHLAQLKAERDQLQANLNAYAGAIQECEYWIAQLHKEKVE